MVIDMTLGQYALHWSLSDFLPMTCREVLATYRRYCKKIGVLREEIEKLRKTKKRGGAG